MLPTAPLKINSVLHPSWQPITHTSTFLPRLDRTGLDRTSNDVRPHQIFKNADPVNSIDPVACGIRKMRRISRLSQITKVRGLMDIQCDCMRQFAHVLISMATIFTGQETILRGKMECGREDRRLPTQRRIVLIVPTLVALLVNVV